jgi:hypothetical protein
LRAVAITIYSLPLRNANHTTILPDGDRLLRADWEILNALPLHVMRTVM